MAISDSFDVSLYADDTMIDTVSVDSLAGLATAEVDFFWTPAAEGLIELTVMVDSGEAIEEPNEANNTLSKAVSVVEITHPMTWSVDDDRVQCPDAHLVSIKDALSMAEAGDTIIVYDGTYTAHIFVTKAALTLKSVNGPEATIIQPEDTTQAVVELSATNDLEINGFTVTGYSHNRGGIRLSGTGCIISNNIIF